ncbi:S-adenosyl-L-methionine-dependent methyltransferase [Lasiosphaeria miniovina]|uniref:S-adenosyl-L-methionine-dependent methyltransferase n=1 Tax=Lasiosphaeria miniovina TaxID=1954250 RepID=A0AA40A4Y9_9PEZI|nr:S-adenosyl-L-methionine-dependent methyltransferase [Lasiosphaeria miniovina]KAK0709352.1 S-adenosyl-L-methionine-dependent methyltransferase [Lasiosphaeria miniovina]
MASPLATHEAGPASSPPAAPAVAAATPQAEGPIEVEPESTDEADSSYGDQVTTFTASLTSSLVNYPIEHGRQYHAYRAGSYPLPNDEPELERLDMTHQLMLAGLNGRLYLAPVDMEKVQSILDVGTGTGIWAIEMGDRFPNAEVLGNDLSAIQPHWIPPNVKFEIDDVESPWVYSKPFDFIFSRYMAGSILNWPAFVQNVHDNLAPGGWAEFQDYDGEWYSGDGSLTASHATRTWMNGLIEAGNKLGRDPQPGGKLEGWARAAGFANVAHRRFKFPIGPWARDPHLKRVGLWNITQVLEGLEAFSLRLYCDVLGWKEDEVVVLLANVRNELKSGKIHAHVELHVVYGQKE